MNKTADSNSPKIINPDLSDIFNLYGDSYISRFKEMPSIHLKTINAIRVCRTPVLGGPVYQCQKCNKIEYSYHSCNNRNCPKCGGDKTIKWVQKQYEMLLPVQYYFATFTLPEEMRRTVRSDPEFFLDLFFQASSISLKNLAKTKRFTGGDIGFMGLIQTWARNLIYHPHIHYLIPGAALTGNKRFKKIKNKKLIVHSKPLAAYFKKTFKTLLKNTKYQYELPASVWAKDWIVDCERAGTGQEVIKYLAPYVHKVALTDSKIKKQEKGYVTFQYTNSKTKKINYLKLPVFEFIRRFLQHVLPSGFMKIRYFGIMGSNMKDKWYLLKLIIFQSLSKKMQTIFLKLDVRTTKKPHLCKKCKEVMILIDSFKGCRDPVPIYS